MNATGSRILKLIPGTRGRAAAVPENLANLRETLANLPESVSKRLPRNLRKEPTALAWTMGIAFAAGAAVAALAVLVGRSRMRGATVGDVMVREVHTVDAGATLVEAARKMRDANVGMLPVIGDDGTLRGLITDRDLVVRGIARDVSPSSVRVVDCATLSVSAARPEWRVRRAMSTMRESKIGRLPVVDDSGRLIGVVTLSSLALRGEAGGEAFGTAQNVSARSARG